MATKSKMDEVANVAALLVTEAVAGTKVTAKFSFPFSIMDKMALVIQRIEYWPTGLTGLNSAGDLVTMALLAAADVISINNQADPLIVDSCRVARYDMGTAASGALYTMPVIKDFTNLAGGGLWVAPNPLYAAVQGNGSGAVEGVWVKLFYIYKELSTDDYWQLVESRRIISG